MSTLAQRLAERIGSLSFDALPADVVAHVKRCVLDQVGIQILGATLPAARPAFALATAAGAAPPVSRMPCSTERVSAPYAALVTGAYGHCCEFDDCHFLCGHPGSCVIPTALALAQQRGSTGREFLTAVVAGYEAMALAVGPIHHSFAVTGWQGTKVGGVFGAVGAAAVLLGLSVEQTAHSLAIAGAEASGTLEYDRSGGEVKRLFPGLAARSGIEAAVLAQAGLTGPLTIFEGERGIYRLFGDGSEPRVDAVWGTDLHIRGAFFKLNPAAGTHLAPIEALADLMAEHEIKPVDVTRIVVAVAPFAVHHGGETGEPADAVGAQYNLGFSLALRMVESGNAVHSYLDPHKWSDPEISRISRSVVVEALDLGPDESPMGARVDVELGDGRVVSKRQLTFKGHADDPAGWADIERKFRSVVAGLLSERDADSIVAAIADLEHLPGIDPLIAPASRVSVASHVAH
jgi:2-methylcitrate dehydratase PrpD